MAYGSTGSGKTHTMYGSDWAKTFIGKKDSLDKCLVYLEACKASSDIQPDAGLILRLGSRIISVINGFTHSQDNSKGLYSLTLRYYQIYNEKVLDLVNVYL